MRKLVDETIYLHRLRELCRLSVIGIFVIGLYGAMFYTLLSQGKSLWVILGMILLVSFVLFILYGIFSLVDDDINYAIEFLRVSSEEVPEALKEYLAYAFLPHRMGLSTYSTKEMVSILKAFQDFNDVGKLGLLAELRDFATDDVVALVEGYDSFSADDLSFLRSSLKEDIGIPASYILHMVEAHERIKKEKRVEELLSKTGE